MPITSPLTPQKRVATHLLRQKPQTEAISDPNHRLEDSLQENHQKVQSRKRRYIMPKLLSISTNRDEGDIMCCRSHALSYPLPFNHLACPPTFLHLVGS
ncbi:hypothetical protein AVEN_153402-1 [Araneus ventricosus]|uniref:Uncharacterized protein n=1 Tax=Araneus ventricosus TaxID=182803 RepID=A0A4Y2E8W9_ARAVE|nr:hypothetical protein AVEN_153402-1 [Araneus ventricosus]